MLASWLLNECEQARKHRNRRDGLTPRKNPVDTFPWTASSPATVASAIQSHCFSSASTTIAKILTTRDIFYSLICIPSRLLSSLTTITTATTKKPTPLTNHRLRCLLARQVKSIRPKHQEVRLVLVFQRRQRRNIQRQTDTATKKGKDYRDISLPRALEKTFLLRRPKTDDINDDAWSD